MKKTILNTFFVVFFSFFFIHTNSSETPCYFFEENVKTIEKIIEQQKILVEAEKQRIALRKKVHIICRTIKKIENKDYFTRGQSGEIGAYQFMPAEFKRLSKLYYGSILETTPANQDSIAIHRISDLLSKGYSIKQIASIWNCGSPNYENKVGINFAGVYYDVPKYVAQFMKVYHQTEKEVL